MAGGRCTGGPVSPVCTRLVENPSRLRPLQPVRWLPQAVAAARIARMFSA